MRRVLVFILLGSLAVAQTTKSTTKSSSTKRTTATATSSTSSADANPTATIHTTAGDMKCTLFKDKVPGAVNNFVGLANGTKDWTDPKTGQKVHGKPLYDGTIFHRVIPDFMIQGGDPIGTGTGDPGYKVPDEFVPGLTFDEPGMLAYANSGRNTNGSQFFITEVPTPFLNPCLDAGGCTLQNGRSVPKGYGYTIFGKCDPATVELVKKIAREPRGAADRPTDPVKITHIAISGAGSAAAKKPVIKKSGAKPAPIKKPGQPPAPKPPQQ